MAAVTLAEGVAFDGKGLAEHLYSTLPAYAVPLFVRIIGAVEATSTFKNRKVEPATRVRRGRQVTRCTCSPDGRAATSSPTTTTRPTSPRPARPGGLTGPRVLPGSVDGVTTTTTLCGRPVAGDRALVMAIVNRTPDSFYDRGASFDDDAARRRVEQVVAEGADIVDIGGVKAGPGEVVDADAEARRVVPLIAGARTVPRRRDQRRYLAGLGGAAGVRRRRRPHQRHVGRGRSQPRAGGGQPRGGPGLLAHRRRTARTRPHRVRYGDDPAASSTRSSTRCPPRRRRAAAAGCAPTGSSSTRRTTSARTPTTDWRCCATPTGSSPPATRSRWR